MASKRERRPNRDGTTSWRIAWREDGKKQSETFATRQAAQEFRVLVEGAGNRWPEGWVKGHGFPPGDEEEVMGAVA